MQLFTEPRRRDHVTTVATWSRDTRQFLADLRPALDELEPQLIQIPSLRHYDYSYSVSLTTLTAAVRRDVEQFADALFELPTPESLMLLEELLFDRFTGKHVHSLFAICSALLRERIGDVRCALHAPPSSVGRDAGEFPLHSDLYVPELLLNVFDNVERDGTGAAIFLPLAEMLAALPALPPPIADRIRACYQPHAQHDQFEEAYSLLHRSETAAWVGEYLTPRALRVRLTPGSGYLLHDRQWLHGRETPRHGVPRDRLHRLIFNNAVLTRARTSQ